MILPFHCERLNEHGGFDSYEVWQNDTFFTHNMCTVIIRTIEPFPHKCDLVGRDVQ